MRRGGQPWVRPVSRAKVESSNLELVWRFGLQSGWDTDKFHGLRTQLTPGRCPSIPQALAWLECRVEAKMDTGDRTLYLAAVEAASANNRPGSTPRDHAAPLSPGRNDRRQGHPALARGTRRSLLIQAPSHWLPNMTMIQRHHATLFARTIALDKPAASTHQQGGRIHLAPLD